MVTIGFTADDRADTIKMLQMASVDNAGLFNAAQRLFPSLSTTSGICLTGQRIHAIACQLRSDAHDCLIFSRSVRVLRVLPAGSE